MLIRFARNVRRSSALTVALALAACLLTAPGPAFGAPRSGVTDDPAGVGAPSGLFHGLSQTLVDLWVELAAPLERLFAANGPQVDPDGTAGSTSGTTTGTWPLVQATATADNGPNVDPDG